MGKYFDSITVDCSWRSDHSKALMLCGVPFTRPSAEEPGYSVANEDRDRAITELEAHLEAQMPRLDAQDDPSWQGLYDYTQNLRVLIGGLKLSKLEGVLFAAH